MAGDQAAGPRRGVGGENDWVMQIKPYNDPDKEGVDPVRPDLPQPGAETAIVATAQPEP